MRPRLRHGLLRAVAELKMGRQDERSVEDAEQWLRGDESATTADIYHELAALAAPRKLADKSPMYVLEDGSSTAFTVPFQARGTSTWFAIPWPPGVRWSGCGTRSRNAAAWPGKVATAGAERVLDTFWLQPHLRAKDIWTHSPWTAGSAFEART